MIKCPECEETIALPDDLVASGVEKAHCVSCGARFSVLPGGHTILLSGNPSGGTLPVGQQPAGAAATSSAPRPSADVASPNFTVQGSGPGLPNAAGASPRLLDAPELARGLNFRGKYRIDAVLGRGGSATVYRAHDIDAEIDRALKVVGAVGGGADGIRRAWAEEYKARLKVADGTHLLTLESPQVEEIEGTTYVALPQELGEITLREWLQAKKHAITEHREEALRLFARVCRGVEALHDRNIAHLDLKPENVLLFDDGGQWTAKVGDFGLARAAGGLQRREGVGTPQYMAPEQVRAAREKDIGPWSDIYALGCMLYELLDGDRPFSGAAEELKDKHLNMAPSELEGVPPHLEQLVMACLAKARQERPATVLEIKRGVETDPAEEAALVQARTTGTIAGWQSFLDKCGGGKHEDEAREALRNLELERQEKERKEQECSEKERREREEAERSARQQAEEARRREQRRTLEPVDIHGWDADRVQERQRKQAKTLGISVVFRDQLADGGFGPEMVLIPSGIYLMGSPADDPDKQKNELPQHCVTVSEPFAIGRYPLTFAEWDAYAEAVNGYKPEDEGWGRGARPVICVSWRDANYYLDWLSSQSGSAYLLPSEAQWEYCCRGGSVRPFNVGDRVLPVNANFYFFDEPRKVGTVPVGSYASNAFGLHDMHGNVNEWTADCETDSYIGAPVDGTPSVSRNCANAILRGGSFLDENGIPGGRSAARHGVWKGARAPANGFRVSKRMALENSGSKR